MCKSWVARFFWTVYGVPLSYRAHPAPMYRHAPETSGHTTNMASRVVVIPDSPTHGFRAGNCSFTTLNADNCAKLYKVCVTVWHLKEGFFPDATLQHILVAMQVGLMLRKDVCTLDALEPSIPHMFDPSRVDLDLCPVGEPRSQKD